ncbi:MAG: tetratricopeptide repeat protein [Lachnospiraceae bacterium]|nr:tetratricopeptide repeat protein [Lachnospiraceae bacterium]
MEKKQKHMIAAAITALVVIVGFLAVQIIAQKLLMNDGIKYLEKKEYDKAYECFQKAEKKHTIFTSKKNIQYYEGESLIYLGRYEDAAKIYGKIVKKHKEAKAYALQGFSYQQNGEKKKALACYKNAVKADEKNGIGYYYLYGYYVEEKEYKKALETIEQALQVPVEEEKQKLEFAQIVVYEKMLKFDKALEVAKKYVKAYPEDEAGKQEKEFLETR